MFTRLGLSSDNNHAILLTKQLQPCITNVVKQFDMIYRCLVCFEEYPLSDRDTLVIDEVLQEGNTVHKYQTYLRNAHADGIIELKQKECPGCKDAPKLLSSW
ncbi:hypothetical protein F444_15333 [Phytophthora nicotianae P1976]|uniref:Uncharacterized protein n=1 Tax=Phytophthora nicotianae P1976 TaxID=1317066 RepID=A0A080ZMB8_PHYNI|nr:hypothetical protein F444_15333 [Phytophthora nicotianae P1976]